MPLAWAAELPESTAGAGTLTVETYQGSTLIGSRSYACTVYVPESVKPSGTLTVSVVNEGAAADWGCLHPGTEQPFVSGGGDRRLRRGGADVPGELLGSVGGRTERNGRPGGAQRQPEGNGGGDGRSRPLCDAHERGGGGAGLLSAGAGDGLGRAMRRGRDAADGRGVCAHSLHGAVRAVPAGTTR